MFQKQKKILSAVAALLLFFVVLGVLDEKNERQQPLNFSPQPTEKTLLASASSQPPERNLSTDQSETVPPTEDAELPVETVPVITADSTFEIYYLDVGQGDSSCVICDGHAMLIDGGNKSASSKVYSFLRSHELPYLDYIVATHHDSDHVGGLAGALNYASVGTTFCNVANYDSEPFQDFLKYLSQGNGTITIPNAGDTFYLGCAQVTILYPNPGEILSDNTSIVLRIQYGDTSFLFTGDSEVEDEAAILSSEYELTSDVIKVAHHGGKSSSTSSFIDSVAPSYAVISVGGSNTYGHPAEEVLSRFKDRNLSLYRTDIQGDIHCTSDGSKITFDVEKNSDFDTYLAAGGYKNYLKELEAARATEPPATEAPATKPTTTNPPETKETTVTVTPTEKIAPSTNSDSTSNGSSCNYIANTNTHKFHYPTCSSVKQMNENNKWYYDGSRNDLIAMGYSPCKKCNP